MSDFIKTMIQVKSRPMDNGKRVEFFGWICLSLKLDASENCRKHAEFLEFEMLFVDFVWRTQKMMNHHGQEIIQGKQFLVHRCVPNHMIQIFQAVWPTVASRGEFGQ